MSRYLKLLLHFVIMFWTGSMHLIIMLNPKSQAMDSRYMNDLSFTIYETLIMSVLLGLFIFSKLSWDELFSKNSLKAQSIHLHNHMCNKSDKRSPVYTRRLGKTVLKGSKFDQ